jgi:hypothetical protein
MACELIAWLQMLALEGRARTWEPTRLRLRIFSAASQIVHGSRHVRLRIVSTWPWVGHHQDREDIEANLASSPCHIVWVPGVKDMTEAVSERGRPTIETKETRWS